MTYATYNHLTSRPVLLAYKQVRASENISLSLIPLCEVILESFFGTSVSENIKVPY